MATDPFEAPVMLALGDDEVKIGESYSIISSILQQPSPFSFRMGAGESVANLMGKYPPGTPMKLSINGILQASGIVDGYSLEGTSGATEITFIGRDALAPLNSTEVSADESFSNMTYLQLCQAAFERAGLDPSLLGTDPITDATARSGVKQTNIAKVKTSQGQYVSGGGTYTISTVQSRIGETWMQFIRRHIDRIGLMIWSAADGSFILSEPSKSAAPSYRILRSRQGDRPPVNVENAAFKNDTSHRACLYSVYGRTGSTKFVRAQAKGSYVDDEMFNLGGTFAKRERVIRDAHVANIEQAEFIARRHAALDRREGYQVHYTVASHMVTALNGDQAVWTPNTIVDIQDDEFNIHGPMWIESCEYKEQPDRQTIMRLMRPADLIFTTDED